MLPAPRGASGSNWPKRKVDSVAVDRDSYMQFYPSDWRGDEQLSACSIGARGLWLEFMCLAHKEAGYVRVNGEQPDDATLARLARVSVSELRKLTAEIIRRGVASRLDDGTLFSRRMVRDAQKRSTNRKNGSNGGNPSLIPSRQSRLTESVKPSVDQSDKAHIPALALSPTLTPEPTKTSELNFGLFWDAYPRKVGKHKALAAWSKLAPNDLLVSAILNALLWQRRQSGWLKDSGEFVPHPSTWINGRRWEDKPATGTSSLPSPMREGSMDWSGECQAEHDGQCPSQYQHGLKMRISSAVSA